MDIRTTLCLKRNKACLKYICISYINFQMFVDSSFLLGGVDRGQKFQVRFEISEFGESFTGKCYCNCEVQLFLKHISQ